MVTFNQPVGAGGFAVKVEDAGAHEREKRKSAPQQPVKDGPKPGLIKQMSKKIFGDSKVHPAKAAKFKTLAELKKIDKKQWAATLIQSIWRGYMVRQEMAFWDDDYWM